MYANQQEVVIGKIVAILYVTSDAPRPPSGILRTGDGVGKYSLGFLTQDETDGVRFADFERCRKVVATVFEDRIRRGRGLQQNELRASR